MFKKSIPHASCATYLCIFGPGVVTAALIIPMCRTLNWFSLPENMGRSIVAMVEGGEEQGGMDGG